MTGVQTCALPICDNGCVPYLILVSKLFSMAGLPNNIPLHAKGYLESGIGLITNLTLSRTLTLTPTLTLTHRVWLRVRVRGGVRLWRRVWVRVRVRVSVRVRARFRLRVRLGVVIKPIPLSRYPLERKGILFGGPAMEKSLDNRRR